MRIRHWIVLSLLLALNYILYGQDSETVIDAKYVNSFLVNLNTRVRKLDAKIDKYTSRILRKEKKQEERIKGKLEKLDSLKAASIFSIAELQYETHEQRLQKVSSAQQYIPVLDTLSSSIIFLQQNQNLLVDAGDLKQDMSAALSRLKGLAEQFQKTEEVRKFLIDRKHFLREQLQNLGFAQELKKIDKQLHYFNAQLNEYKELLKDHKKAERKALELLTKTKLFQNIMRKNSMLASLFRLPGDPDDPLSQASLSGLQTRDQVTSLIQNQIAAGGPNAQQQFSQKMQQAQSQLTELKNKIEKAGIGCSDAEIPEGFKHNSQKTKSFFQRLELGTNIQSQKPNGYFPVTSDVGLSIGYKLNDKSILGIGASYKVGWGQNIRHINISHQGIGLRSFVEMKIKRSFWLSGGYETNYRSEFRNVDELRNLNAWQESGLAGISKVVSLKTRFFKRTKLQLLWDFLSYEQVPRTQPIVFRIGYGFR